MFVAAHARAGNEQRVVCFDFFFQAEDGIRDVAVTGVQTCALPISKVSSAPSTANLRMQVFSAQGREVILSFIGSSAALARALLPTAAARPRVPGKCTRTLPCFPASSRARPWFYRDSGRKCLFDFS